MWSLRRDGQGSPNEKAYYLVVGEHLVGRKDCQIQIAGDQSVSRKHAWITVSQNRTGPSQVSLKDVSKFGCLVNDIKCQNSVAVTVKHDDKITFGTQNSSYRLKCEPLVVFASCLDSGKKKDLKSQLSKLGGYMVNEWQKGCSHLVMEALTFTVKVIYALVTCSSIVVPSFFDDLVKAVDSKSELPLPEKYMPVIKEDLIDPEVVSFHPNKGRTFIFAGKLFLFLEKKQLKRLEQAITLAGGKALLKETGDISGNDDNILTDQNTLVMSVESKSGISEEKEMWIGHVGDVLKSVNRRPIAETEVGLAILHMSLEEYCNPSINRVPRIAKQIISKSISTMEEMSQKMNESQNVSISQVSEKKPFWFKSDHPKPSAIVTTPQESRKRSRHGSEESQPLAFETPQSNNTESKRRKISPTDVTHVSQTPESQFKTPGIPKGPSAIPTNKQSNITHISQSENCELEDDLDSPVIVQKRKALPKNDITHISQSQESQHKEKPDDSSLSSPDGNKLRSARSNTDVKRTSQYPCEITHISQSQESQSGIALNNNRRPKRTASEDEDTVVPETSPIQMKVKETPSPEISFISKRRKISSPDLTHISERPAVNAKPQRSVSSPRAGPVNVDDSVSTCVENIATTTFSYHQTSVQNLSSIKASVTPPGSGWMSKKSFSMTKEKTEMNQSENRTSNDGGIEDLGESRGFQERQGVLSNQEKQTLPEELAVKKEENSELPNDLMCVEHIELVVTKSVSRKTQQSGKKFSTTLKNMKRFRKQNYPGDERVLPRIIGGRDLVVFSTRSGNVEDWLAEVQAMNQQDTEDREADDLFRYEPNVNKRRNRR